MITLRFAILGFQLLLPFGRVRVIGRPDRVLGSDLAIQALDDQFSALLQQGFDHALVDFVGAAFEGFRLFEFLAECLEAFREGIVQVRTPLELLPPPSAPSRSDLS